MKILNLKIRGYRSLQEVEWTPADLNLLIGPNAGGKTNLLRALELLSFAARGHLSDAIQREGGMGSVLWDGSAPKLEFVVEAGPIEIADGPTDLNYTYELVLARLGSSSTYQIESELLSNYDEENGNISLFHFLGRSPQRAEMWDEKRLVPVVHKEALSEQEALLAYAAGPFSATRLAAQFQAQLASWQIYQSFRTEFTAPVRQPAITSRQTIVAPDGANLVPVLHTLYTENRQFHDDVNAAMSAAFGGDFLALEFPPAAEQRVQLAIRWRGLDRSRPSSDLSDGTLRFLFLLAVLANPNPGSLIALDEPEVGLHPSMLPIIAEFAVEAASRTQVVLTTHSPDFLDAFPKDASIAITVVEARDGASHLHTLPDSDLDRWLSEYSRGALFRSGELEALA